MGSTNAGEHSPSGCHAAERESEGWRSPCELLVRDRVPEASAMIAKQSKTCRIAPGPETDADESAGSAPSPRTAHAMKRS